MTKKIRIGKKEMTLEELGKNMGEIVKIIDQPGSIPAAIISGHIPDPVVEEFNEISAEVSRDTS